MSSHTSLRLDSLYCQVYTTQLKKPVCACASSEDIPVESRNSGQSAGIKEAVTGKKSSGIISYGAVNVYGKGQIHTHGPLKRGWTG